MEYLLISLLLIPIFMIYKIINKSRSIIVKKVIFKTQARTIAMLSNAYESQRLSEVKNLTTQSTKFFDKKHPKILIMDDEGYWIKDNAVYCAEFDGMRLDQENAIQLDTMTMNDVQLKKLIFIIEQLTKGLDNEDSSKWH